MAEIGKRAQLEVIRFVEFGSYLNAGALGEVLFPLKYEPEGLREGDRVDVFLYHDSEGRPVATTETPLAEVGEFAALDVVAVTDDGAFLDWGLTRALFVPFREQKEPLFEGDRAVVYLYIDEQTGRVVGSTRLHRFLDPEPTQLVAGDSVELLLYARTALGYKALINRRHTGILFHSAIVTPVDVGSELQGHILQIRDDGKIDLTMQMPGPQKVEDFSEVLLRAVQEAEGILPFGDHSSPEEIRDRFGVSKKTFKKAAGALFKQRKIVIYPRQILLQ